MNKTLALLPARRALVSRVAKNSLKELMARAQNHPQFGDPDSSSPAYRGLAVLSRETFIEHLAFGLKHETGELAFLDMSKEPNNADEAFVSKEKNLELWRRLEELIFNIVNSTMIEPGKPVKPPEEVDL